MRRMLQHMARVHWVELLRDRPRQDPPRVVVDDRVEVSLRTVEQPDDGHVDMPRFVWSGSAKADSWLRRMHPQSWSSPTSDPNQLRPSSRMSKHPAIALRVQSKRPNRHMSIILRLNQLSDGFDFAKGQA